MALKALASHVIFQTHTNWAGDQVDDGSTLYANLVDAGGKFYPMSDPTIAAGSALCAKYRARGLNETEIDEIMGAFVSSYIAQQAALGILAITAGNGISSTGGQSPTLSVHVDADASLAVAAGGVKVGVLATDAQHGNRGGAALHAAATDAVAGFMSAADKTKLDSMQKGTATLVGGTASAVAATITAGSKIFVSRNTAAGVPGVPSVPDASVVVGAPGHFDIVSDNVGDTSTVNWFVIG